MSIVFFSSKLSGVICCKADALKNLIESTSLFAFSLCQFFCSLFFTFVKCNKYFIMCWAHKNETIIPVWIVKNVPAATSFLLFFHLNIFFLLSNKNKVPLSLNMLIWLFACFLYLTFCLHVFMQVCIIKRWQDQLCGAYFLIQYACANEGIFINCWSNARFS